MKALYILLFYNISFAQQLPVLSTTSLADPEQHAEHAKNGNYAVDTANERNQYVGLWEYNQNGTLFQLKLEKQDQVINKIEYNGDISHYNYTDIVLIRYKLVKNGVEIFNNISTPNTGIDITTACGIKQGGDAYMYGQLLDHTRNVVGSFTILRLNTNPEKIIFSMDRVGHHLQNPSSYYDDGQPLFSFPQTDVTMNKIQ